MQIEEGGEQHDMEVGKLVLREAEAAFLNILKLENGVKGIR